MIDSVIKILRAGATGRSFDVKATDMWLLLNQSGRYVKAWNLLSPGSGSNKGLQAESGTPSIVMPRDSGAFEIHLRLKNFGGQRVSAAVEGQTVEHGRADTHQGELMISEYQDLSPGEEAIYMQSFPAWAQSHDQRTWIRVGNERQELVDYRGSSRHLTYINVEAAGGPSEREQDETMENLRKAQEAFEKEATGPTGWRQTRAP